MSKNNYKKPKFNQMWSNQTNLGKKFGLSAIAVSKLLIQPLNVKLCSEM